MEQTYPVAFYKRLVDSNSHPGDACQAVFELRAPNKERAITDARLRFAELNGVGRWSLRADYESVAALNGAVCEKGARRAPQLAISSRARPRH